jgi:outer membrane protein assembly factor BamA
VKYSVRWVIGPRRFYRLECGKIRGIGLIYNSRDDQLFPTRVFYLESSLQQFGDYLGADFNYGNLLLDARKLFPLKKNKVVATNFYAQFNSEGAPFFALAQVGGNKALRGLFEGKFRDRNVLALQGE